MQVNIASADGTHFFHTHLEGTPASATRFSARANLHASATTQHYLVAATWSVDATSLGVCVDEYTPHAHGLPSSAAESSRVYPLLQAGRHHIVIT